MTLNWNILITITYSFLHRTLSTSSPLPVIPLRLPTPPLASSLTSATFERASIWWTRFVTFCYPTKWFIIIALITCGLQISFDDTMFEGTTSISTNGSTLFFASALCPRATLWFLDPLFVFSFNVQTWHHFQFGAIEYPFLCILFLEIIDQICVQFHGNRHLFLQTVHKLIPVLTWFHVIFRLFNVIFRLFNVKITMPLNCLILRCRKCLCFLRHHGRTFR